MRIGIASEHEHTMYPDAVLPEYFNGPPYISTV